MRQGFGHGPGFRLRAGLAALAAACLALPALAGPAITIAGGPRQGAERVPFTVLASAPFAGPDGPGAALKHGFEASCGCVVTFVGVDDPLALLPALRLGAGRGAEVVVGLPLSTLEEARASGRFAKRPNAPRLSLPIDWTDEIFLPLDYGWLGLVYDATRLTRPPYSWPEIAAASPQALRVALDDPQTSASGLDALLWVRATHKDKAAAIWAGAKPKLVVVGSRAESLAKLEAGEVDMALAATTWPATRGDAQDKPRFKAAPFREGQFLQVESAAIVKDAAHPEIAARFMDYLVSPAAQAAIAARRGMYPTNPAAATPAAFQRATLPSWSIALDAATIEARKSAWLAEWSAATAR